MKIQENSKKFNIFLQILMCFFIEIWPKNDILTQKKLQKIPGIQPIHMPPLARGQGLCGIDRVLFRVTQKNFKIMESPNMVE